MLTYADGSYEATWNALFAACNLFRETAESVGAHFDYDYPAEDDPRVSEHLKRVRGSLESVAE
jgi:aminoglycoside 6-adenylyltransferase